MSVPATAPAAVAAWGLPTAHRLPDDPLTDDDFDELVTRCTQHRILGLLGAAVGAGDLPVTADQRERLDVHWQDWLGHAVRAERAALTVSATLTGAGIPSRVLKGLALAHTSYPDPAMRVYGDVDLLVPHDRLHAAATLLEAELDGGRAEPEVRPGFDDRFAREAMVRALGVEVDLHRTLVNGAYGVRLPLPTLFDDGRVVTVGGGSFTALATVPRLLHAAYQSTLADSPPRLVALRDLVQILTHDGPDARDVVATARAWRGAAPLAAAVRLAWRTLRLTTRPSLVEWAEEHRTSLTDRVLLGAARGGARGYTAGLTTLVALPSTRDRIDYARAVLAPSAEYREARGFGRWALVGAGTRRLRSATRAR